MKLYTMKKQIITLTILLGLGLSAFAQSGNHNGGMFQKGPEPREYSNNRDYDAPMLPSSHGETGDQSGPLGSGVAVLLGLGAAYLVGKKGREE